MKLVLLPLAALLAACSSLGTTKECTLVACADNVTATFELDRTAAELRGGSVRVCRDDQCATAQIVDRTPSVGCSGNSVSCSGDPASKTLVVSLVVQPNRARDGEVFDVVVLAPTGEPIASRRGSVAYTVSRPNGPECEPECRTGELK